MKYVLIILFIVSPMALAEHDGGETGEVDAPAPLVRRDTVLFRWSCEIRGYCATGRKFWVVGSYCASSDPRETMDSEFSGEALCKDEGVDTRQPSCEPTRYRCSEPGRIAPSGGTPPGGVL